MHLLKLFSNCKWMSVLQLKISEKTDRMPYVKASYVRVIHLTQLLAFNCFESIAKVCCYCYYYCFRFVVEKSLRVFCLLLLCI
jgi:hypothetical protein